MYVVIATVTCQGGADFSEILTLKRLFHALAAAPGKKEALFQGSTTAVESRRLSHLQRKKNFPNSPAKQKRTVGANALHFPGPSDPVNTALV